MKLRKKITALFTTLIVCGSVLVQPITAYAAIQSVDVDDDVAVTILDEYSATADTLSGIKRYTMDADGSNYTTNSGGVDYDLGNSQEAWDGYFRNRPTSLDGGCAYSQFSRMVTTLPTKDGLLSYSSLVGSNSSPRSVLDSLLMDIADGDLENLVGLYSASYVRRYAAMGNDIASAVYMGCDYSLKDSQYYYYYIDCSAIGMYEDNIMVVVFCSESLIYPDEVCYDLDGTDADVFVFDDDVADSIDKSINKNIYAIIPTLLTIDGKSVMATIAENPTTALANPDIQERLEAVDELLNFNKVNPGDNWDGSFTIQLEAAGAFKQSRPSGSMHFLDADYWNDDWEEICIEDDSRELMESNGCFDDSYINFGENGAQAKDNSDALNIMVADIINDVAYVGKSNTDLQVQAILDAFGDNYEFVPAVLEAYATKLQESINAQALDPVTEENLVECNLNDKFKLANTALGLIIQQYTDGVYVKEDYELSDGSILVLDSNMNEKQDDTLALPNNQSVRRISLGKVFEDLDAYQRYVLYTATVKKIEQIGLSNNIISWCSSDITSEFSTEASGRIITHANMPTIEIMQERIAKYEESGLTLTGNLLNVARCSNILGQYSIMSSLYTNSSDISSIYQIYNANLDSLLSEVWDYGSIEDEPFIMLPKRIGIFGSESADYVGLLETEDNWNRFVCMLYNVSYAFEVCAWSELGEEEGFTPEDIKNMFSGNYQGSQDNAWVKFLCSNQTSNLKDVNTVDTILSTADPEVISMLRSVCELGKLCDFLGIKEGDWSPTIDAYLEIWHDPNYKEFWTAVQASKWVYATAEEGAISVEEPLGMFFNIDEREMTDQWVSGFALSALHVPMETNLYDASSVTFLNNPDWVSEFFYRYGFNRKALYINTDNAAIVNQFVSGQTSGTRPATLSDLINYDRDIILTVDDNFYNADEINTVISRLDYTSIKNSNNEDTEETGNNLSITENLIGGMLDLDAEHILKTGPNMYYSEKLATKVTKLGDDEGKGLIDYDAYVLSSKEILGADGYDSVIESYEYSVKQSYGVVSAIYRSESLYNECLRAIVSDNAVFKSSKAICSTPGTTSTQWRCVYNYYMLANLEEQMKNDAASTLDLDAPIFIDIFGNIVTESGLVIIPAACNATLCGENWTPYTVGWSEYYNNGVHMTTEDFNEDVYEWLIGQDFAAISSGPQDWTDVQNVSKVNAGGYFWIEGDELKLRTSEIQSGNLTGTVQWEYVNKNSTVVKQLFYNDAYFQKGMNMYSHTITNLIVEVMRGAPIEYIDYSYEDLDNSRDISKYGVYIAYKLEELYENMMGSSDDALGGNSVVTQPNLAFVSGLEYIYLYIFKIVFAVCVVALAIHLYLDVVKGHIGLKSVGSFLMTVVLTVVAITLVPKLNTWTYYQANRDFLREEAGQLLMLNYVKEYDGAEIGITKVTAPETDTKLYLKVADADVPWYSIIPEVLFGDTNASLTELYENHLKKDPMALTPGVQLKGDGLYVDIQDILDSSEITFAPASNVLQHYTRKGQATTVLYDIEYETKDEDGNIVKEKMQETINIGTDCTSVVSFTLPYYVFLEQLVASVNEYNVSRDVAAYSWSVGNNGHVLTYDLLTPYLTSSEFLDEGYDILGLDRILKTGNNRVNYSYPFDTAELNKMEHAFWYHEEVDETMTRDKIDKVYQYARDFVRDNQDVLGKVPDEVFLKTLAMQCAIAYNKEFGVPNGNAIEIIDIDTRDLIRFMLSDYSDLYKNYSYSFTRNTYEQAGAIGVILAGLLLVIYWLGGFLKIALQFALLGLLVINVLGRKLIFRKESRCIEGYLIGCGCLCLVNYAYAIMLKVTMSVANMGFGAVMALLVGMIAQILYIVALVGILFIEIKDWKNSGYEEFAKMGHMVVSGALSFGDMIRDKTLSKFNSAYGDSARNRNYTGGDVDSSYIDEMLERDAEREENAFSNSV